MIATKQILARTHDAVDRLTEPERLRPALATAVERGWTVVAGVLGSPATRRHLFWVVLAVAGTTTVMLPARELLGVLNELLIFLLLTFVVALSLGSGPATLTAVLSFLAFDLLFIPPYYTFSVAASDHVLALFVYLGVAVVTGQLVARVRTRTEIAEREQRRTGLLYELNAALVGGRTADAILATIVERVVGVYGANASRILVPDAEDALRVAARYPSHIEEHIDRTDLVMAAWAMEHRKPAGRSAASRRIRPPYLSGHEPQAAIRQEGRYLLYFPIATADRVIGVLEVVGRPGGGRFSHDDELLLGNFADQAALALERAQLAEAAARAAVLAESDALKSALLSAVSHDLRTPLATIMASATSLLDPTVTWRDEERAEFLQAIDEEADRLSHVVSNLLDLSRIEGGALRPEKAWYDVAEVVVDVASRLSNLAPDHHVTSDVEPDLPLVQFDYVEIAQVLMNLGENAAKYTPPGSSITLSACRQPTAIELAVGDTGPGIPPHFLPRLFEPFSRADQAGRIPGTGIGLTISKGLVEAHGGHIWVESHEGHGTTIAFTLPLEDAAKTCA
jgi:two-component system sensor histidine kinase KdpD